MTEPFKFFPVRVKAIQDLSPGFRRFTFTDPSLATFADPGLDQRIKLLFPIPGGDYSDLLGASDWFAAWRELPDERRHPIRTYTTRYVRTEACEIDVDVVVHGEVGAASSVAGAPSAATSLLAGLSGAAAATQSEGMSAAAEPVGMSAVATAVHPAAEPNLASEPAVGPASKWIANAQVGDELLVLGPNAEFDGEPGGIDFVPPAVTERFLIAGDETAAPAISVILEQLPASARGMVVLEVPTDADRGYLPTHPGIEVRVVSRDGAHGAGENGVGGHAVGGHGVAEQSVGERSVGGHDVGGGTVGENGIGEHSVGVGAPREHGAALIAAVREAVAELAPEGTPQEVEEIDVDADLLWEVPRHAKGGAALKRTSLYAWLAGEAGAVKTLRRHLVSERGIDRRTVAFMGYWRIGKAEN